MFYNSLVWGQRKLGRKWKLTLVLAGPPSQAYVKIHACYPPDVLLTMDKSNERLFKEVFSFVAIGVRFKNDSVLFYIIEFCGNESTNGGKEDFEVILIVIW